jgi:hypothetical protein
MNVIEEFLPLLIPIVAIQLVLVVIALFDLSKRTGTRGPKWMWAVVIIFVNFVGPIAYFAIGREDE